MNWILIWEIGLGSYLGGMLTIATVLLGNVLVDTWKDRRDRQKFVRRRHVD